PTIRADITPRQLSVIGAIAKDKIYDGTQVTEIEGAILDGVLVDDDVMLTNHSRGYFVGTGVGSGIEVVTTMTLKGNRSRNYSLIQPFLTAQILPLGLSVTGAVAQDKVYDGLLEAEIKGAELSGVVGNDD